MSIPYKVSKAIREKEPALQTHTEALSAALGIPCKFVLDYATLAPTIAEAGYEAEQYGDIFYESYPENIANNIRNLIDSEGSLFKEALLEAMPNGTVTLRQGTENDDWTYQHSLFENGGLVIEFGQGRAWTNVGDCATDIPGALTAKTPDGHVVPYNVSKALTEAKASIDGHAQELSNLIGVTCSFVIDYDVLNPLMRASGYQDSQFGEIFYQSYPENIVNAIRSLVEEDAHIKEPLAANMSNGTVTIRGGTEGDWNYHRCIFENGGLVIEIGEGRVWTNISDIGKDIPDRL